jgi:hypothetical protein
MKHTTHTPGPWVLQKTPSRIEVKQDALHTLNFVLNDEPNARLIACAPELLQIAEDLVLLSQLHDWEGAAIDNAKTVLLKVKGKL